MKTQEQEMEEYQNLVQKSFREMQEAIMSQARIYYQRQLENQERLLTEKSNKIAELERQNQELVACLQNSTPNKSEAVVHSVQVASNPPLSKPACRFCNATLQFLKYCGVCKRTQDSSMLSVMSAQEKLVHDVMCAMSPDDFTTPRTKRHIFAQLNARLVAEGKFEWKDYTFTNVLVSGKDKFWNNTGYGDYLPKKLK